MALVQPLTILPTALPESPILPEFETYTARLHYVRYLTSLEEEHSRDLYLQGAMAVGQIARLLEELCADDAQELAVGELATPASEDIGHPQFVSHEKRGCIEAWARDVDPEEDTDLSQQCYADPVDMEDGQTTYLRGAFVVGDIADLLEDLVKGFSDSEDCAQGLDFSPEQTALEQLPDYTSETPDSDLASRLGSLSARLAKLEMDIDEFLQERCDALTKLDLEVAAEEQQICNQDSDGINTECSETPVNGLGLFVDTEAQYSLPITRIWTTADTATSGFSIVTPSEAEVQPLDLVSIKGYFWSQDSCPLSVTIHS